MWKKIAPIAGVLLLTWIVLDLFSSPDSPAVDIAGDKVDADAGIILATVSTTEVAAAETEATVTAATTPEPEAKSDAANVQMRYPTDPVTGATVFDQGMLEVIIEPEPDVVEEEQVADTSNAADTVATDTADATTDNEADAGKNETSTGETEEQREPVKMEMRYPTDPVTGATLFDGGQVEVEIVAVPAITQSPADATESFEGRLPVDPVTGATIHETAESEEPAASEDSKVAADASPVKDNSDSSSLPTDPVTGATIHASAESDSSGATDESDSSRLPTDPVTGATIHESTQSAKAADTDQVSNSTGRSEDAAITPAETTATTAPMELANRSADIGGMSRKLGGVFGSTSVVLTRSSDKASATAAVPRLETASSVLSELAEQYRSLPDYAIAPLNRVVRSKMAELKPLVDTALIRPEVGSVLSPVLMPMLEQLQLMAR